SAKRDQILGAVGEREICHSFIPFARPCWSRRFPSGVTFLCRFPYASYGAWAGSADRHVGLTDHRKSGTLRWSQPARPAQRIPLFVSLKPPQSAEGIAFLARAFRQFCEVRQWTRPCPAGRSTGRDGDSAVPGSVLSRSPSTSVPALPRLCSNPRA